jgi:hypothetical protein
MSTESPDSSARPASKSLKRTSKSVPTSLAQKRAANSALLSGVPANAQDRENLNGLNSFTP